MKKASNSDRQLQDLPAVTPAGSLGLLALGARGVKAWKEAILQQKQKEVRHEK